MKTYAVSFSGGKDSTLALDRAIRSGLNIRYLFNIYNSQTDRVRFHGFKKEVIISQAKSLDLELIQLGSDDENFEEVFVNGLKILKDKGVDGIIFGDIHLEDVRNWSLEKVKKTGLEHVEPLWKNEPENLVRETIKKGYGVTLTSLDLEKTKTNWLGKTLDNEMVNEFLNAGIDPCGENGEYHSFVNSGPIFKYVINFEIGSIYKTKTHASIDINLL